MHGVPRRRGAYVLLETVLASGLLLLGLTVIGTQLQESRATLREMRLRLAATQLAESHLSLLDLGLLELDSIDEEQEEDFGPRYPDFAWRLTIDETASAGLYLLKLEILHHLREDLDDEFAFDDADTVYTLYAMRPAPQKLDLAAEFGLTDEEMDDLSEKLGALGVEGISPDAFDPAIIPKLPFDDLVEVLPAILDAFGVSLTDITALLPPEALEALRESGMLDGEGASDEQGGSGDGGAHDGGGG